MGQVLLDFLYTNIGRGHPHYLDGIIECLPSESVGHVADVFSASDGIARPAWSAVRRLYHAAAKGGIVASLYNKLRTESDYDRRSTMLRLLSRGLTRAFPEDERPLVVGHPLLVAILTNKPALVYQHGEVVAPRESWVKGPHRILVPLPKTADTFLDAGFSKDQIFVSGLCVEPSLAVMAESAMNERSKRLSRSDPLCGAFFSSGAEPLAHVEAIVAAALSVHQRDGRAIVFAQRDGRLEREMKISYGATCRELKAADSVWEVAELLSQTLLCRYRGRKELNEFTEALFADFDYFVAPSHERTNWALGLGLPMFVVDPPLGSFAPLNRQVLLDAGVAKRLRAHSDATDFGEAVNNIRGSGELHRMAEAGWQDLNIRGFENIAAWVDSEF